jgi:phosphoglycolate phosphatase
MTIGRTGPVLDAIDLVVFDKDGTIIDFRAMWATWAIDLSTALEAATGRTIEAALFTMLGFERASGRIRPDGGLAATPMSQLRERTLAVLVEGGLDERLARAALEAVWHAPDPVGQAHPLADLPALFARLHDQGIAVAIATSDDRGPTLLTLDALGVAGAVDAICCADDGIAIKPAPDPVLALCESVHVDPLRTAVIGDAPADLEMGRAAGVARTVGVLTGVGTEGDLWPSAHVVIDSVASLIQ